MSPERQPAANAASWVRASSARALPAAWPWPPARSSEGCTRVSRSRSTGGILASQGSVSPIVPMPCSWDIDDAGEQNVRGRSGAVWWFVKWDRNQDAKRNANSYRGVVRIRFSLACDGVRQSAAGAFAFAEFVDGGFEIGGSEIGPAFGEKHELGESAFPQEKIGKALFAAGADEEIDLQGATAVNFGEDVGEGFGGKFRGFVETRGRLKNGFARGVIDGQAQMQPRAARSGGFGIGDDLAQRKGNAVAAADDGQTDALIDTARSLD